MWTPSWNKWAPQAGQTSGLLIAKVFSSLGKTPKISGITSFDLLIKILELSLNFFLFISSKLFNVALFIVTPSISTGSIIADGVTFDYLPTFQTTSSNLDSAISASNL